MAENIVVKADNTMYQFNVRFGKVQNYLYITDANNNEILRTSIYEADVISYAIYHELEPSNSYEVIVGKISVAKCNNKSSTARVVAILIMSVVSAKLSTQQKVQHA